MAKQLYTFRHPLARRVQTKPTKHGSVSKTQSEFAKELDINYLVERHMKAGIPFPTSQSPYADVADFPTFSESMDIVVKAQETWLGLNAKFRRYFGDKVENFLDAIKDPERVQELTNLGLYKKPVEASQTLSKGSGEAPPKAEGGGKPPGTVST